MYRVSLKFAKTSFNFIRFKTDFEPLENLGMGGFGSVFKAKHKLAEKLYAVKIIRCEE